MILTFHPERKRYEFATTKTEKDTSGKYGRVLAREARFIFDWDNLVWQTTNPAHALQLAAYADDALRAQILEAAQDTAIPRLTFRGGAFLWTGPVEGFLKGERVIFKDIPKAAGFAFAGPKNKERWERIPQAARDGLNEPVWWTCDPSQAFACIAYADDIARKALQTLQREKVTALASSRATDADITIPAPDGLNYLPYQRAGIAYGDRRRHVLFGDEMGLGKTIQAIGLINLWLSRCTAEQIRNFKCVVVCPASLKLNWKKEMEKWLVFPLTIGLSDSQRSQVIPNTNIVIVNFEQLGRDELTGKEVLNRSKTMMTAEKVKVLRQALRIIWHVLIVDECHKVKNPDTIRTRLTFSIQAKRSLFLSGTPLVNRPKELFGLANHLAPTVFPDKWKFYRRYCQGESSYFGNKWDGAQNLYELQEKMRTHFMIRRLKKDVLTELPAKRRQVIELPATGVEQVVAEELIAWRNKEQNLRDLKLRVELAKASENPDDYKKAVGSLKKCVQVAFEEMSRLRYQTAIAKIPVCIEHVAEALSEGNKIIVFAHHKEVVRKMAAHFHAENPVTLTGDTKMIDRDAAVTAFQENPDVRLFIGTIMAAGVGLTLTASSHVIFLELDWVPGNITQAEDRAHRIGQHDSVLVQHLVLEGSLDARMAVTLVEKQEISDQALDIITKAELEAGETPIPEPVEIPQLVLPDKDEFATHRYTPAEIAKEATVLSKADIAAVHLGVRMLAGVCDRAYALDDAGFNAFDAPLGHHLAEQKTLTPRYAALGKKLLMKYRNTQLAGVEEIQRLFVKGTTK